MPPRPLRPAIRAVRTGLRSAIRKSARARRLVDVVAHELDNALEDAHNEDDFYGARYYGVGRRPGRGQLSGYEVYDRHTSHANKHAYLLWKHFDVQHTLDVGCALGFVVEALRELGIDAEGIDVSEFAIANANKGAKGHVRVGSLLDSLPCEDASFDLVTAIETLEHLEPETVPHALSELRRITRRFLVATIPSFGPNEHGPDGWLDGKVLPSRLDHYRSLGPSYEGPVAFDDLERDEEGNPVEGHLTIASFSWWTQRFNEAGFERCPEMEKKVHEELARFGLTGFFDPYVLMVPGASLPEGPIRSAEELAKAERRFKLAEASTTP